MSAGKRTFDCEWCNYTYLLSFRMGIAFHLLRPNYINHSIGSNEIISVTEEPLGADIFTLLDKYGNIIEDGDGIRGLLTYNGGTVCDAGFGSNEAHAICDKMGYSRASNWNSYSEPYFYGLQRSLNITLDGVDCEEGGNWSTCSYRKRQNCVHDDDVFITCVDNSGGENLWRFRAPLYSIQISESNCSCSISMYVSQPEQWKHDLVCMHSGWVHKLMSGKLAQLQRHEGERGSVRRPIDVVVRVWLAIRG